MITAALLGAYAAMSLYGLLPKQEYPIIVELPLAALQYRSAQLHGVDGRRLGDVG